MLCWKNIVGRGFVMQHGDISGEQTLPEKKGKMPAYQRGLFGLMLVVFFCLYPAMYVFATHLSGAQILANARAKLGSSAYPGLCERLVANVTHHASYPSADIHMRAVQKAGLCRTDWSNMQPGDIIFFCGKSPNCPYPASPPYGHIGIYSGGKDYISAAHTSTGAPRVMELDYTKYPGHATCYQSMGPPCDPAKDPSCPPPGSGGGTPTPSQPGAGCCENSGAVLTNDGREFTVDPCKLVVTPTGLSCPKP
jgi:hypothetical protein